MKNYIRVRYIGGANAVISNYLKSLIEEHKLNQLYLNTKTGVLSSKVKSKLHIRNGSTSNSYGLYEVWNNANIKYLVKINETFLNNFK